MLTLPGHVVVGLLDHDTRTRVYRGTDWRDGAPVILKAPTGDSPDPRTLERLRLEHALLREFDSDSVPRVRGLLGATQLERQAQLLEAECRIDNDPALINLLLDQVAVELAPVMRGLQSLGG